VVARLASVVVVILASTSGVPAQPAPGVPPLVATLAELRQTVAAQRCPAARIVAQTTRIGASTDGPPPRRIPEDYGVGIGQEAVAWGPGELFVDQTGDRILKPAEGDPRPEVPEARRYWHTRDGSIYILRSTIGTEISPLSYGVRARAEALNEPDTNVTNAVEYALQVPTGPVGSLPRVLARGLEGDGARVGREVVDGVECIRVDLPLGHAADYRSTWFAPDRGYLAVRWEETWTTDKIVRATIYGVREFSQVDGAGWFPALAEVVSYRRRPGNDVWWLANVCQYVVSDIRAVGEAHQLFSPWFPNATLLRLPDGVIQVVGGDLSDLVRVMSDGTLLRATPPTPTLLGGLPPDQVADNPSDRGGGTR